MNSGKRMWAILGMLAAAMTATAALLARMDGGELVSETQILAAVRSVWSGLASEPIRWNRVQVGFGDSVNGASLAAIPKNTAHFIIHVDGAVSRSTGWESQESADATVRIEIDRAARDGSANVRQLASLRAVVVSLRNRLSNLTIQWPASLSQELGLPASSGPRYDASGGA